jgi:putative endonuclease
VFKRLWNWFAPSSEPLTTGTAREKGFHAERFAEELLLKQGFNILRRQFSCKHGEIDLVCQDGETLVFVEVRCREADPARHPLESVNPVKQRRICHAARYYLATVGGGREVPTRFDIVWITTRRGQWDASGHERGAFTF